MGLHFTRFAATDSGLKLTDLNDAELLEVMSYMSANDLRSFSKVCKRFAILFKVKFKSTKSVINVNRDLTSSLVSTALIDDYKSTISPYFEVSLNYRKMLNVLTVFTPRLQNLWLDGCEYLTDNNLHLIGDYFPCLRNLWLFNLPISDRGLQRLFTFAPRLEKLVLKSVDIRGHCFEYVGSEMKSVSFLICWGPDVEGYRTIAEKLGDRLEEIAIVNKGFRGDAVVRFIVDNFPKLKSLQLTIKLSLPVVSQLKRLKHLRQLRVMLEEVELHDLHLFHGLQNITSLELEFDVITDHVLSQLLSSFKNVEELALHFVGRTNRLNATVDIICSFCNLRKVSVTTLKILDDAVEFVRLSDCNRLKSVNIGYVDANDVFPIYNAFNQKAQQNQQIKLQLGTRFLENFHFGSSKHLQLKLYSFWDKPARNNPMLYIIDLLFLASFN